MEDPRYKPHFPAMVASDYQTAVWLSVPMLVWFLWLIVPFFRAFNLFTWVTAVLTVLCIYLWIRHWRKVNKLLATGVEITGKIKRIQQERTRSTVTVTFRMGEEDYAESIVIARSKRSDALQEGANVRLIVDKLNPESLLLLDLYLRAPSLLA